VPKPSERIIREQEFIEATSRICSFNVTSRPGIPISPIEIRLTKDRLSLVSRVLSNNSEAYKYTEVILDLVLKLGFKGDSTAEVKVLGMISDVALQNEDFDRAYKIGKQIITNGNLLQFFNQVRQWYGDDPSKVTPYQTTKDDLTSPDDPTSYLSFDPPPASDFDLHASAPTHYESNYVYVPWANDWDAPEHPDRSDSDETHPENQNFLNVAAPNFASFFNGSGRTGEAFLNGPLAYGADQFVPQGAAEPYTIQFQNAPHASSTVGEIRIVTQLDSDFDPRSFRLGDFQIGDLKVHVPAGVGSFQNDFDFTQSKGFILRVSVGIELSSNTATWLLQAIDPLTGEVIQDPTRGLLPPDDAQGDGRGVKQQLEQSLEPGNASRGTDRPICPTFFGSFNRNYIPSKTADPMGVESGKS